MNRNQRDALAVFIEGREDLLRHIERKGDEFAIAESVKFLSSGEETTLKIAMAILHANELNMSELSKLDSERRRALVKAFQIYLSLKTPEEEPCKEFNQWLPSQKEISHVLRM